MEQILEKWKKLIEIKIGYQFLLTMTVLQNIKNYMKKINMLNIKQLQERYFKALSKVLFAGFQCIGESEEYSEIELTGKDFWITIL